MAHTLTSGGGSVNAAAHSDGGMGGGKMFGNWDENSADTTDTADNAGSSDTNTADTDSSDTDDGTVDSMKE